MKLPETTFYAAHPEGLVLTRGYEFAAANRAWVIYKDRFGIYLVCDKETGHRLLIRRFKSRAETIKKAIARIGAIDPEKMESIVKHCIAENSKLSVLPKPD